MKVGSWNRDWVKVTLPKTGRVWESKDTDIVRGWESKDIDIVRGW